jgi:hypothetical protein
LKHRKIEKIVFGSKTQIIQFFWRGVSNFSEIMGLILTKGDDIDYKFLEQLSQN